MQNKNGLTLVELAIVIVIIGILLGGVFAGRDLIHQAQIHKVLTQINDYNTGLNSFYLKYKGWPGDFKKAHAFSLDTHTSFTDNPDGFNDGDGDGFLESTNLEGTMQAYYFNGELTNFWVHLSNAELTKGSYSADGCVSGQQCAAGTAFPSAPLGNGIMVVSTGVDHFNWVIGLNIAYNTTNNGDGGLTGDISNYQSLAGFSLTPYDAWAIDKKLDDGVANTGSTQFFDTYGAKNYQASPIPSLYWQTVPSTAACLLPNGQYNVIVESPLCSIWIKANG